MAFNYFSSKPDEPFVVGLAKAIGQLVEQAAEEGRSIATYRQDNVTGDGGYEVVIEVGPDADAPA